MEPCIEIGRVLGVSACRCCHGIVWREGEDFGEGRKGVLHYACEECVKDHGYKPLTEEDVSKFFKPAREL